MGANANEFEPTPMIVTDAPSTTACLDDELPEALDA